MYIKQIKKSFRRQLKISFSVAGGGWEEGGQIKAEMSATN